MVWSAVISTLPEIGEIGAQLLKYYLCDKSYNDFNLPKMYLKVLFSEFLRIVILFKCII